ncbi:MAG TPA: hypothetical protein VHU13_01360, partial [Solirubrobacteraceae bacterium]|nr:hypothetical protein [Solirubrobacteraceae bacterium]
MYEIERPSFPLAAVKKALFESTYQSPVVLHLQSERDADAETPIGKGVDVVVVTVQAVYLPLEPSVGSGVFGCHNEPEWYVRGYLYKSPFDPHDGPIRVHVYLEIDGGSDREKVDRVMVQFVHEPS